MVERRTARCDENDYNANDDDDNDDNNDEEAHHTIECEWPKSSTRVGESDHGEGHNNDDDDDDDSTRNH